MPRPKQCPTPMASTELQAMDERHTEGLEMLFELPPSALKDTRSQPLSFSEEDSEYQPPTPKSKPGRKSSTKRARGLDAESKSKEQITLPPPPGRARKVIEMKPNTSSTSSTTNSKNKSERPAKKSSTSSRKISRKTAHSLIERRRRGKMNDEFEVLKDMVPACADGGREGREMHKLEILKASVEYIRYLKDCVCKLQGGDERPCFPAQEMRNGNTSSSNEDEDTDVEMSLYDGEKEKGTPQPQPQPMKEPPIDPQLTSLPFNLPPTPKLSPAILPQPDRSYCLSSVTSPLTIPIPQPFSSSTSNHRSDQRTRNFSTSSTSAQDTRHFSYSPPHSHSLTSTQRQLHSFSFAAARPGSTSTTSSAFTSPLLAAQADQDATVALLMLNGEWPSRGHMGGRDEPRKGIFKEPLTGFANPDRGEGRDRGAGAGADRFGGRRRGLSVNDLLSS